MKLAKYVFALFTGLFVSSSNMMATATDGIVTVNPTAPNPNPVCLGSSVSVTVSGSATNPTDTSCEITITNQIWSWVATDSSGATVATNYNGGSSWSFNNWTPASCGNQTLTVTATVEFQGTQCKNQSYDNSFSGSAPATVKVVSISLSMTDGQRIGITANGHDRTKHFSATVCPADEAGNVFISSGPRLHLSNERNQGNGVISFDLVGTIKSDKPGDTYVEADYWTGGSVKKTATVIIPADVGKPHPTFDGVVTPFNLVGNASSSPSFFPSPPSSPINTDLQTLWITTLTIPVVDQFGSPCADLYDGSIITENGGTPINKTLSGSSYTDPVGPGISIFTTASDPRVALWPISQPQNDNKLPVGKKFDSAPSVEVDGFTLTPGLAGRSFTYMGNNRLKIEWP